jgi:hypothetical protein
MDRNTIQKILIGLFLSACIFIGLKTFNVIGFNENPTKPEVNTNVSSSRMTYGRFLRIFRNGLGKTS